MLLRTLLFVMALAFSGMVAAAPKVEIDTSLGKIEVELDAGKSPDTVKNFVQYVKDKFYDGLIFHRVIPDFMIQGGGFMPDMEQKTTRDPIQNEAEKSSKAGLLNKRGTIAMARTSDPHSATAQFFINVKDNDFLDFKAPSGNGWGYAVFGKVTKGMEVVDKIVAVPTGEVRYFKDVPLEPVFIKSVRVISKPKK